MAVWDRSHLHRLTVRFEPSLGYWRVRGSEGDYGITQTRAEAISIACGVTRVSTHWMGPNLGMIPCGYRPIAVYRQDDSLDFVLTRVRGPAPPLVDQNEVS